MLSIDNITAHYYTQQNKQQHMIHVLGPLNLTIKSGEIVVLLGPSGCGKSTLLKLIAGLMEPSTGTIQLEGQPINYQEDTIAYMPQHYGLLPWKTVNMNIRLPLILRKQRLDTQGEERLCHIVETLGLGDLLNRFPSALSGGQQQRVAIARGFMMQPDVLLLDEPFSALDSLKREEAQGLFLDVWKAFPATTLLVTHSIEEAVVLGERILLFEQEEGKPGTVAEAFMHPFEGDVLSWAYIEERRRGRRAYELQQMIRQRMRREKQDGT